MRDSTDKKGILFLSLFLILFSSGVLICLLLAGLFFRWLPLHRQVAFSDRDQTRIPIAVPFTRVPAAKENRRGNRYGMAVELTRANQTLAALNNTSLILRDPLDIAARLKGISVKSISQKKLPADTKVGDQRLFWVLNIDDNRYRQLSARLVSQTPHLNFWIEDGVQFDVGHVRNLVNLFEERIYPTNREIFGSEWSPGIDGDERLVILYTRGLGGAAGYHSAKDALSSLIDPYSNEAEMFYLSADYLRLDDEFTYGVLAHEFQHMFHWNTDRNESAWINEGLSELAVELNGFSVSGFDWLFAIAPDLPLTFWPGADQGDSQPHYGASYLFMKYFLDRFGIDAIRQLATHPENGLTSIDRVLADIASENDETNHDVPAEALFQDWTIANFLQDARLANGIYAYSPVANIPQFLSTERITCGSGWQERDVHQFGTDYIQIECDQPFTIEITGEDIVPLLPVDPISGDYYIWSNYGNESLMRLSRSFDFSDVADGITMEYWTWFDIERDYDYAYLLASVDGINWEILEPPACTVANPTGANYGCGYNGRSSGWVRQQVDLSRFAGQTVTLAFEYLTDGAVNGDGLLLDDIAIERIGYFTDFEEDDGGWQAEGFVRVSNGLPQAYAFSIIEPGPIPEVKKWLTEQNLAVPYEITDGFGANNGPVLAISGITRHTRVPAVYSVRAEVIP